MDKKTQSILNKITASMPAHLKRGIVQRKRDTEYEDRAKGLLSDRSLTQYERNKLKHDIDAGHFKGNERDVVNDRVAKQIDQYYTAKIAEAIKSGQLKKADMSDPMVRRHMKK